MHEDGLRDAKDVTRNDVPPVMRLIRHPGNWVEQKGSDKNRSVQKLQNPAPVIAG